MASSGTSQGSVSECRAMLNGPCQANCKCSIQYAERAVIMPSPLAQPHQSRVKGEQRNQGDIWIALHKGSESSCGCSSPNGPATSSSPGDQRRNRMGALLPVTWGRAMFAAGLICLGNERGGIYLAVLCDIAASVLPGFRCSRTAQRAGDAGKGECAILSPWLRLFDKASRN